jgi:hypothetical protein
MKKEKIISKCCVCGKVKRKEEDAHNLTAHLDSWGHHEKDIQNHFHDHELKPSHGYCDECSKQVEKDFNHWLEKNAK